MKKVLLWLLAVLTFIMNGCAVQARTNADTDDTVKVHLLMEAMDDVGVCRPEQAVDVWVQGLMKRSAAMQYAVMDDALRKSYAKSLEKTAPNWVTGTSSPWVSGYAIGRVTETAQGQQLYTISVMSETSTGPAGEYLAVLAVHQDGEFWRIGGISADDGLSAFSGFE